MFIVSTIVRSPWVDRNPVKTLAVDLTVASITVLVGTLMMAHALPGALLGAVPISLGFILSSVTGVTIVLKLRNTNRLQTLSSIDQTVFQSKNQSYFKPNDLIGDDGMNAAARHEYNKEQKKYKELMKNYNDQSSTLL